MSVLSAPDVVPVEKQLPSGRSVVVRFADGREELEVRSPTGAVEIQITLTDAGPVVRLSGARLELAADTVAVDCRRFEVRGEEVRMKTTGDIHLDGDYIRLNCEPVV